MNERWRWRHFIQKCVPATTWWVPRLTREHTHPSYQKGALQLQLQLHCAAHESIEIKKKKKDSPPRAMQIDNVRGFASELTGPVRVSFRLTPLRHLCHPVELMCVRDTIAKTIYSSTASGGGAGLIRVGVRVGRGRTDVQSQSIFFVPAVLIISCNKCHHKSMVGSNCRHTAGDEMSSELFQRLVEPRETKWCFWKTK